MQGLTHQIMSFGTKFIGDLYSRCAQSPQVVEKVIAIAVTAFGALAVFCRVAKDKLNKDVSVIAPSFTPLVLRTNSVEFASSAFVTPRISPSALVQNDDEMKAFKPEQKEWEDTPDFKLDLMQRAYAFFGARKRAGKLICQQAAVVDCETIIQATDQYFREILDRLEKKENVPIPFYYHASAMVNRIVISEALTPPRRSGRDSGESLSTVEDSQDSSVLFGDSTFTFTTVEKVVLPEKLKPSRRGGQESGVYLSTVEECQNPEAPFGDHTFALDPSAVETNSSTYRCSPDRASDSPSDDEGALWIAHKPAIELKKERVAFVILPNKKNKEEFCSEYKDATGDDFPFPIVTKLTAREIRICIQGVHVHFVPKAWKEYVDLRDWQLDESGQLFTTPKKATGLRHIVVPGTI